MEFKEIMYRIAENHNRLAQVVANGVDFKTGDNVVLMGEVIKDLRTIVHEMQVASRASEEQAESESK